ncbi:hypothetical protein TrRE_jg521, partial [Triparma retinervis]
MIVLLILVMYVLMHEKSTPTVSTRYLSREFDAEVHDRVAVVLLEEVDELPDKGPKSGLLEDTLSGGKGVDCYVTLALGDPSAMSSLTTTKVNAGVMSCEGSREITRTGTIWQNGKGTGNTGKGNTGKGKGQIKTKQGGTQGGSDQEGGGGSSSSSSSSSSSEEEEEEVEDGYISGKGGFLGIGKSAPRARFGGGEVKVLHVRRDCKECVIAGTVMDESVIGEDGIIGSFAVDLNKISSNSATPIPLTSRGPRSGATSRTAMGAVVGAAVGGPFGAVVGGAVARGIEEGVTGRVRIGVQ